MCGIAGMMAARAESELADHVARMTQRQFHRGPDDGGLVTFLAADQLRFMVLGRSADATAAPTGPALAALGARRLAILDLSPRGRQPMASADGRTWIAFNGEVYNYRELGGELRATGRAFVSDCDTEVVLAAWQAWGPACFSRFDGMWAVALYDRAERRLTLARDPFGVKPLYFVHRSDLFAFSSEIRPLLALPGVSRAVNEARLVDFLCEGWIDHTDETLFRDIRALPAGGVMTVTRRDDASIEVQLRRDDWPFTRERELRGPMSLRERPFDVGGALRAALDVSIRRQLRSDVEVGSCLSGGIDSSAIVTTIAKLMADARRGGAGDAATELLRAHWSQHVFTAVLPGDRLDESRYAVAAAAACGEVHQHTIEPTPAGLLADLDRLLLHQEQPFGSPSIYMQWEVMKRARDVGVRVLLDGQGGDELFCGYAGYVPPWLADLLRRGRPAAAAALARSPWVRAHLKPAALMKHAAAHLLPAPWRERLRRRGWLRRHGGGVHGDLLRAASGEDHGARESAYFDERVGGVARGPFGDFYRRTLMRMSLPALLRYEDRSSMAFSIEARVPLLGRGLAELAVGLPPDVHLHCGRTKAALRDALRGRAPDVILDRRDKIGFAAPTTRWMQGALRGWWRDVVHSASYRQRGWFDPSAIALLEARLNRDDEGAALRLWRLSLTELWARELLDQSS